MTATMNLHQTPEAISLDRALWAGRTMSALVVIALAADGAIQLFAPAQIASMLQETGFAIDLTRVVGPLILACAILYAIPATAVLGAILSRDSPIDQRMETSLLVQGLRGCVDCAIESDVVGEGVVGEMVRLEIMPDDLDVVELGCVFRQPLDGEPVLARFKGLEGELADVDRPIVLDQHDGLDGSSWLGAVQMVELLQVGDEVAGPFGHTRVHGQLARDMIERSDHRHFLGLSRRRHSQVRTALGPCARQIRVCQGLALVAIKENDVAGLGLGLAQLKAQPHALDLAGALADFQRVAGPPPAEVFFRSALDSCDLPILTPSRASISVMRRGIVQFGRSAAGASSRGATTRSAASVFTGGGPGATVAFNASTPPRANSLRQRRTVSSRTLKASAMRGLVHPDNVSNIARARSASPRLRESTRRSNHTCDSLVKLRESA